MVSTLKWTTVTNSEVEQAQFRLEASVFNVEAKIAKSKIEQCKYELKPLCGKEGIANVYHRLRFKRIYVDKSDYPIFQPSQITEICPKPSLYLSEFTLTDIPGLRVKKNQILMTCSGTIGKCSIVTNNLDNQIFSHDLLRITAKEVNDTGYIYSYLKSQTGQLVLLTNNYGAVIQHIEPEHLFNIKIPYADKNIRQSINDKILHSFELRDLSNNLILEAENSLIEALKLPPLDQIKAEHYNQNADFKNFSLPFYLLDDRLDASYHVPIALAIVDILLDNAATILPIGNSEISDKIILPGRFKRIYVDEADGTVFLGGKQIYELDPTNKKYLSVKKHGDRIAKQLFLHENMIAITCSGTIGKVNIIPKHWENWTMSQHVLRIVPKNKDIAGYLYIWLNTDYARVLVERHIYGSVVDEIDDTHLAKVPVPVLEDRNLMKRINDLALKANELRSEAYYLEQEAISEINEKVIYS
ncbi:MAG: hypothetical protein FD166_2989 [Bacteroidetes bacterium]|nr:MAG: hypothetical protein FD166_2989 [Bacteroidota bacterium]